MKKILSTVMSLSLAAGLIAGTPVMAANDIIVELDGQVIEFDVNPEIVEGRTLVPLRKIFEEIGALVKWDNETRTVSARKSSKTITLTVGSADLKIDKGKTDDEGNPIVETVTLEVPAQIVSGRTLVPVRAISESFGLNVDWDKDNKKVTITEDAEDDSWKENTGSIDLTKMTFEGDGIEISGNQIKITSGGDFALSGTLKDGNIVISTKEKVKLRLKGANITSSSNPCIFVEKADKAYITISGDTENVLVAENSQDGAIYSKEKLEIKGNGSLAIESKAGHGIKAADNLDIENGNITINAASDGIHINDTFKMIGGTVDITSVGDGIDSESIVNISGGKINIETNGTPIEATQPETTEEQPRRGMWGMESAGVEFENSTKGINAEWMMVISGGEITINSASHAIHCSDEIEINGGKFELNSKYDKGISAHGNLTINGADTVINVTKSDEAIESKKLLTINDGYIKAVASDDALNATGGNSGMMMPGRNFGGNIGGKTEGGKTEGGNSGGKPADENTNVKPEEGNAGENSEAGKNTQPTENGKVQRQPREKQNGNKNTRFPFERNENGEFVPTFEIPEGSEMTGNGNFTFPFNFSQNGEFTPPTWTNPNQGEGTGRAPGGFMGGRGDMKNCIVINGGYLELTGNDDCIDANGNLTINGGTVMANNPTGAFTGNFGVLDGDGKITVGEDANVILASSSGSEKSLTLSQNAIIVYCENQHEVNETIKVTDSKGNVVYEYAPQGKFKTVLIASKEIKDGEKYKITIGNESFETEITSKSTIIGTPSTAGNGMGGGRMPRM